MTVGPQTSYRGELQGAVLVTAESLAEPGDTLTMDNQAPPPGNLPPFVRPVPPPQGGGGDCTTKLYHSITV